MRKRMIILFSSLIVLTIVIVGFQLFFDPSDKLILIYTLNIEAKEPDKPLVEIEASWRGQNRDKIFTLSAPMQDQYVSNS